MPTNDPLGDDAGKALPSPLAEALQIARNARAEHDSRAAVDAAAEIATGIPVPVLREVARLKSDHADKVYIGERLESEVAYLKPIVRAYAKRTDASSVRLTLLCVEAGIALFKYHRQPSDDCDCWDEMLCQDAARLVQVRDALGVEPGPLYMRPAVQPPQSPSKSAAELRRETVLRRRGRKRLGATIVQESQHIAAAIASADAWLAELQERGYQSADEPRWVVRFIAQNLRGLTRSDSTARAARHMLRCCVRDLTDGVPGLRPYIWTAADERPRAVLIAATLLAIGDREELPDGRVVDPIEYAASEPVRSIPGVRGID